MTDCAANVVRLTKSEHIMVPMVSSCQNCIRADGNLKHVDAESNATRRPSDIQYVKIACDVVFTDLTPDNTQPYPFTFFVWLKMDTRTVSNSTGNDVQLTTFFGPTDWATSNDQAVLDAI